jgi:hypothetical protein
MCAAQAFFGSDGFELAGSFCVAAGFSRPLVRISAG